MKKNRVALAFFLSIVMSTQGWTQSKWINVDSLYQPLPPSVHVFFSNDPIDTAPFRAYYLEADLKDKRLSFGADTSHDRRLIPTQFFEKNGHPLVVVNTTFFSYATNRSLNTVIKNGELVAFNQHSAEGHGKDTFTYKHPIGSAIGISKNRKADIAWLYTDSASKYAYAIETAPPLIKDSSSSFDLSDIIHNKNRNITRGYPESISSLHFHKWKMQTAVGGGPVLIQEGEIKVTNEEEMKFTGKDFNVKHPRTAMGYTNDGKLIILMIEGRNNVAHGATLTQEAQIFKELQCVEALNLDGGGSSCMLVNGKETIKISDAAGQRPVPSVFLIHDRKAN